MQNIADVADINDTIVAPATPLLPSPISIVRISGGKTIDIIGKIINSQDKIVENPKKAILTKINDRNGEVIDECIIIFHKAPYSYTGEDMVEIFLHGNPILVEHVIKLCIEYGARYAREGEFTKRAYLNRKISLDQAEAVNAIINASTIEGVKKSVKVLEGEFSAILQKIGESIKDFVSAVEASIDFPEDVDWELPYEKLLEDITALSQEVKNIITRWTRTKLLIEGATCTLVGKPNVGKSTLFNCIIGRSRSIVSPTPGTTRDYIDAKIDIGGAIITIVDTAGIRKKTEDPVEIEGIKRTLELIQKSDVILCMFDSTSEFDDDDDQVIKTVLEHRDNSFILPIINKIDAGDEKKWEKILMEKLKGIPVLKVSSLHNKNVKQITESILEFMKKGNDDEGLSAITLRQKTILNEILKDLEDALRFMEGAEYIGSVYALRSALSKIDDILGKGSSHEIIENIFKKFCIGK